MRRTLLTVDFSYQVYRASAANAHLCRMSDETFTGGLYGFLMTFAKAVRETCATDVLVCLDSKPYLRSRDYPAYKQLRKNNADNDLKEKYKVAEPQVLELLDLMGVPVWSVPGMEADDLCGWVVTRQRCRYERIYAQANDSDLFQLFEFPNFEVYNDHIRNTMNRSALLEKYGLTPAEFMLASALQGTHNDIEGIPNVGAKRAAAAIHDPALMRKYRSTHADVIDRNLELIRLPHREMSTQLSIPRRKKRTSVRHLYRWAMQFDIDITSTMADAFEQI